MQKRAILFLAITSALLILYSAGPALALSTGLHVDPGMISSPGGTTTITLVTPVRATGTLTVTNPNGTKWTASIDTGPSSPHTQTWKFPDDFPTGDTNSVGSYDVVAELTMQVSIYTWKTCFEVEFFVIPTAPLGILGILAACFAGLAVKRLH